jgi:small nuclear ribonucleoprotein (snRNP)-like protein
MIPLPLRIFLIATFFLTSIISYSKDVILVDEDGNFKKNYSELIKEKNLSSGDKIKFSDDETFIFRKILGEGSQSKVFEVVDPTDMKTYALKVPIENSFSRSLNSFIDGYDLLKRSGVETPNINKFKRSKYALLNVVDTSFSLEKFLARPDLISKTQLKDAEKALYQFAKDTAQFETFGDFNPDQLVYSASKKRWYLLDWNKDHVVANLLDESLYNQNTKSSYPLQEEIFNGALYEYDDEMNMILEDEFFEDEYLIREQTIREKKISDKLKDVTLKQRSKIIKLQTTFWAKHKKTFIKIKTPDDLIKFYSRPPSFFNEGIKEFRLNHFLENIDSIKKYNLSLDQILKLRAAVVSTPDDFLLFTTFTIDNFDNIDDLQKYLNSFYVDSKNYERIKELAKNKIDQILKLSGLNNNNVTITINDSGKQNKPFIQIKVKSTVSKCLMEKAISIYLQSIK